MDHVPVSLHKISRGIISIICPAICMCEVKYIWNFIMALFI